MLLKPFDVIAPKAYLVFQSLDFEIIIWETYHRKQKERATGIPLK
jgi:hypothetical protein